MCEAMTCGKSGGCCAQALACELCIHAECVNHAALLPLLPRAFKWKKKYEAPNGEVEHAAAAAVAQAAAAIVPAELLLQPQARCCKHALLPPLPPSTRLLLGGKRTRAAVAVATTNATTATATDVAACLVAPRERCTIHSAKMHC